MSRADDPFSQLLARVGRQSRYAGLGFIALSVIFLVLSASDGFVVFEVDSIVSFLAAIFLLFKDPSARVHAGVLDAVIASSDQVIAELVASQNARFTYLPTGEGIKGVVVMRSDFIEDSASAGGAPETSKLMLTPPGRGLAELYMREVGMTEITMEGLRASLSDAMRENFGLARSVDIDSNDNRVSITLHGAAATCTCEEHQNNAPAQGSVGCTLASFLAVLITAATKKAVSLERCVHDVGLDTWAISMDWAQSIVVTV